MSVSIVNLYSAISCSVSIALNTNIWWTMLSLTFAGNHRHCATGSGDSLAVRSRSSGPNTKGPATECAAQSSDVDWWSVMLTSGDVGDRNAAVDQVFRCSVLQILEHCDCELVLHSLWNVEPVQLVVQQLWQSMVVLVASLFHKVAADSRHVLNQLLPPLSSASQTIVCVIELISSACRTTQDSLWIVTFLLVPCSRMFIN